MRTARIEGRPDAGEACTKEATRGLLLLFTTLVSSWLPLGKGADKGLTVRTAITDTPVWSKPPCSGNGKLESGGIRSEVPGNPVELHPQSGRYPGGNIIRLKPYPKASAKHDSLLTSSLSFS